MKLLPIVLNILTTKVRKKQHSLESCWLFPEERKGCYEAYLYIDYNILKENKTKQNFRLSL